MAHLVYNHFRDDLATAAQDLSGGTYKVMCAQGAYTPDAAHQFVSSVTNECTEVSRITVTGASVSEDDANGRVDWLIDNMTFGLFATQVPRWAIIYKFVTNDSDSRLVCAVDLGFISPGVKNVTIKWNNASSNGAAVRLA